VDFFWYTVYCLLLAIDPSPLLDHVCGTICHFICMILNTDTSRVLLVTENTFCFFWRPRRLLWWVFALRNVLIYLLTLFSGEAAAGISREDYIDAVANDILVKLPTEFDIDKIRKKFGSSISPTSVVLLQELERFNNLLIRMRKSLTTLRKVLCYCVKIKSTHRCISLTAQLLNQL